METNKRLMDAVFFAAVKHQNQRRKSAGDVPYVNHVIEVGKILAADGQEIDVIIAGILHDVLEDTTCSSDEIKALFGDHVCKMVEEVSDNKNLPKAERKQKQIDSAPFKSVGAKAVKIADKISNLSDLKINPPLGWSTERCLEYARWSKKVIDALRGSHPRLEKRFDDLYDQY